MPHVPIYYQFSGMWTVDPPDPLHLLPFLQPIHTSVPSYGTNSPRVFPTIDRFAETIDGIERGRGPVSSIRPIRRLVLLNTILGASRKSLCAHSSVIYRSEIPTGDPLYSLSLCRVLGIVGQIPWLKGTRPGPVHHGYGQHRRHLLFLTTCHLCEIFFRYAIFHTSFIKAN